jgi:putative flippase GtrA
MTLPANLKREVFYFVSIGAAATVAQLLFVFLFVSYAHFHPLIANVLAFFFAFQVSFFGHRKFTFSKHQGKKTLSLPHFFTVAASAGLINEALYFLFLRYTNLNYMVALFLVINIVAIYNFLLARFWACR